MLTTIVAGLGVVAALAQPAEAESPAAAEAPAPVQRPGEVDAALPPPATTAPAPARTTASAPAVSDAAWDALVGRNVEVQTSGGPFQGELLRSDGAQVVLVKADGNVVTIPKANATAVRVVQPPPAAQPQQEIAALEAPADPVPADEEEDEGDEELTEAQKRRKERRDKREHALLGAFTMHGATYSHWRGEGVNAGHASYAMDWGVGFNFSKNFGLYALAGGLFGAKIGGPDDEAGNATEIKANYGHVGGVFAFGGQWYYSTIGAGAAFSRLRYADGTLERDKGLAIPSKLMARIPLGKGKMKKYYLGIGLTYELAMVRNFNRYINAIGGQIVFGRW
ncbi:MAG: hypothetical protein ACE37F_21955 [Nannocystaceae bacterium]|nr:hypothetical protein [bacterium]